MDFTINVIDSVPRYVDGKAIAEPEDIRDLDKLKAYIDNEVKTARYYFRVSGSDEIQYITDKHGIV